MLLVTITQLVSVACAKMVTMETVYNAETTTNVLLTSAVTMHHATTLNVLSLVQTKLDTKTMTVPPMVDKYPLTLKNMLTILIIVSLMPLVQITLVALHANVIVSTVQAALIMTAMLIPIATTMVTLVHAKMNLRVMNSIVLRSMNA